MVVMLKDIRTGMSRRVCRAPYRRLFVARTLFNSRPIYIRYKLMAYLLVVSTVLCWSGNFIVARGVHAEVPPIALAFWRWAMALLVILPFSFHHLRRQWRLLISNWKIIAFLAILSVSNFSMFIYMALNSTTAINAVLVNSLTPVFIVIVSWGLGGERATAGQAAGILISLSGLLFIITRGNVSSLSAFHFSGETCGPWLPGSAGRSTPCSSGSFLRRSTPSPIYRLRSSWAWVLFFPFTCGRRQEGP